MSELTAWVYRAGKSVFQVGCEWYRLRMSQIRFPTCSVARCIFMAGSSRAAAVAVNVSSQRADCGGYKFVTPPPDAVQAQCTICLHVLREPCLISCPCGQNIWVWGEVPVSPYHLPPTVQEATLLLWILPWLQFHFWRCHCPKGCQDNLFERQEMELHLKEKCPLTLWVKTYALFHPFSFTSDHRRYNIMEKHLSLTSHVATPNSMTIMLVALRKVGFIWLLSFLASKKLLVNCTGTSTCACAAIREFSHYKRFITSFCWTS